ncbi:MAG: radical SAM protein [Eubacteriales bacterium]|nr:radical SAM protein [Eubacteriales bacterium]
MDYNVFYSECRLCPRKCGVDRTSDQRGFCGMGADLSCARASLHMWEEPCLSLDRGSGTVFFSGCNLRCVYCQNRDISTKLLGKKISTDRLVQIFFELKEKGALNINLVTAAHFAPQVADALDRARSEGLDIPVVYNSSGYESVDTLRIFEGLVDIYLPDFKYMSEALAKKYSGAADYPCVAMNAIREMVRQQPKARFDTQGGMLCGVIVRHLLLPECTYDSKRVLEYLHKTYGNSIYVSIMRQYTPIEKNLTSYPELCRRITDKEYERIVDFADRIGIENGFLQQSGCEESSFIPSFDFSGV